MVELCSLLNWSNTQWGLKEVGVPWSAQVLAAPLLVVAVVVDRLWYQVRSSSSHACRARLYRALRPWTAPHPISTRLLGSDDPATTQEHMYARPTCRSRALAPSLCPPDIRQYARAPACDDPPVQGPSYILKSTTQTTIAVAAKTSSTTSQSGRSFPSTTTMEVQHLPPLADTKTATSGQSRYSTQYATSTTTRSHQAAPPQGLGLGQRNRGSNQRQSTVNLGGARLFCVVCFVCFRLTWTVVS